MQLFLSKLVPVKKWRKTLRNRIKMHAPSYSFSQEGEDLILNRIFEGQSDGFYVDVGAHHPFRFSNTAKFYKRGWRGINIDPLPGTRKLFNKYRPHDINLEFGVALSPGNLVYYMFNDPALNTFDKQLADSRNVGRFKLIDSIVVPTMPLAEVLEKYLPDNQCIDFMTIDAEGLDVEIVKSNNWGKFKPKVLLIEALEEENLKDILESQLTFLMDEYGYEIVAKTLNTLIFARTE